ncbi:ankyrin repeat protein [mine drainage metagenome]|uniref:Ankyrin repeat protein n=1 Tax=mine drainage metagenome TaxID=410659 RepID=A0A1J5RZB7_9ZZZZ
MKFMRVILAVLVLGFSFNAMAARALTDDESVEFTGAVGDGNMPLIKKYVESGVDVNVSYFAWSPLLMAAAKDKFDAVKYLVEHGADLNYAHPITKWTAFIHAAYDGNEEMVKYLAAKGADINKKMRGNVSVVRFMRDQGNTKMVNLLLSLGVKDDGCQDKCF